MVARAPVFLAAVMACVTVLNDGAEAFTPVRALPPTLAGRPHGMTCARP